MKTLQHSSSNASLGNALTDADLAQKVQVLGRLLADGRRVVHKQNPYQMLPVERLHQFDDIFLSPDSEHSLIFTDFDGAYDFGKRAAKMFGFGIRIKTSSSNEAHGVTYKYVCCAKEGFAASATAPSARRRRNRESARCGCPWIAKLIGVHMDKVINQSVVADRNRILQKYPTNANIVVWFWDSSNKSGPHNHQMDIDRPLNMRGTSVESTFVETVPSSTGFTADAQADRGMALSPMRAALPGPYSPVPKAAIEARRRSSLTSLVAESPLESPAPMMTNSTTPIDTNPRMFGALHNEKFAIETAAGAMLQMQGRSAPTAAPITVAQQPAVAKPASAPPAPVYRRNSNYAGVKKFPVTHLAEYHKSQQKAGLVLMEPRMSKRIGKVDGPLKVEWLLTPILVPQTQPSDITPLTIGYRRT